MKLNQIATSSAAALLSTSVAFQPSAPFQNQFSTCRIATRSQQPLYQHDPFRKNHIPLQYQNQHQYQSTRLYGRKNDNEEKSLFERAADKVKSILPFSKSKSKSQLTKKEQSKQDVSNSIDTILKDAPLGVRMFGKMMKPIVGKLIGGMAQAMEEQQKQMSEMLLDARNYIVQDPNAVQLLGEPVEMGSPLSQSSSSMSVNGETRSNLQASFEVRGGRGTGIATMSAVNGRIENLSLNIDGRNIAVDVTKRGDASYQSANESSSWDYGTNKSTPGSIGKNRNVKDDDVIDAEFVEKK